MDPKIPIMVLPGTIWSFQVLNRVLYLWQPEAPKKVLWSTFFLRVWALFPEYSSMAMALYNQMIDSHTMSCSQDQVFWDDGSSTEVIAWMSQGHLPGPGVGYCLVPSYYLWFWWTNAFTWAFFSIWKIPETTRTWMKGNNVKELSIQARTGHHEPWDMMSRWPFRRKYTRYHCAPSSSDTLCSRGEW